MFHCLLPRLPCWPTLFLQVQLCVQLHQQLAVRRRLHLQQQRLHFRLRGWVGVVAGRQRAACLREHAPALACLVAAQLLETFARFVHLAQRALPSLQAAPPARTLSARTAGAATSATAQSVRSLPLRAEHWCSGTHSRRCLRFLACRHATSAVHPPPSACSAWPGLPALAGWCLSGNTCVPPDNSHCGFSGTTYPSYVCTQDCTATSQTCQQTTPGTYQCV